MTSAYDIYSCQKDFCNAMVNQHNKYRKLHQVDSLSVDNNLMSSAQKYAMYLAENSLFDHSGGDYGEN